MLYKENYTDNLNWIEMIWIVKGDRDRVEKDDKIWIESCMSLWWKSLIKKNVYYENFERWKRRNFDWITKL